jgi:hypothetical protein
MAIFNSYVCLPEGIAYFQIDHCGCEPPLSMPGRVFFGVFRSNLQLPRYPRRALSPFLRVGRILDSAQLGGCFRPSDGKQTEDVNLLHLRDFPGFFRGPGSCKPFFEPCLAQNDWTSQIRWFTKIVTNAEIDHTCGFIRGRAHHFFNSKAFTLATNQRKSGASRSVQVGKGRDWVCRSSLL